MGTYYAGMMNATGGSYLRHHGILGQKWGVRRWQNEDGSLTPEGRIRYSRSEAKREYGDSYHRSKLYKQASSEKLSSFNKNMGKSFDKLKKNPGVKYAAKAIQKEMQEFRDATKAHDEYLESLPKKYQNNDKWLYESDDPKAKEWRRLEKEYYKAYKKSEKAAKKYANALIGIKGLKPLGYDTNWNAMTVRGNVARAISSAAYDLARSKE